MTGLVSFPSFHSVAGVLFAWALWPIRWLRWPFVALNLALIAATPVYGAHYFIDIPAGIAVALVAIWLAEKCVTRAEAGEPRSWCQISPLRVG